MCAAAYQLQLFGEDPEAYYDQFFDDDRHRIVLRPTKGANMMRLEDDRRVMRSLHWGLVPHWAKDRKIGYQTFNARAETIAEKPAFRESFKRRRGILIWDSYIEWREEQGKKIPYEFSLIEPGPICFAGLWASWGQEGDYFESCTLITCPPNALAAEYHDRMPVILAKEDFDTWLDPGADPKELLALLTPFDAEKMAAWKADPLDFKTKAA
jgi:putative SOS response-associated peptidase YedK